MAVPTFVAGAVLTAAQLNTISTALTITDAWTSYTPTLTQSATVTKTVTSARYTKVGRWVKVQIHLDITGAGTGANDIVVGLPAFVPVIGADNLLGGGWLSDQSTGLAYHFWPVVASSTTFKLLEIKAASAKGYLGTTSFTAALASGDFILATFEYESTT